MQRAILYDITAEFRHLIGSSHERAIFIGKNQAAMMGQEVTYNVPLADVNFTIKYRLNDCIWQFAVGKADAFFTLQYGGHWGYWVPTKDDPLPTALLVSEPTYPATGVSQQEFEDLVGDVTRSLSRYLKIHVPLLPDPTNFSYV